MADRRNDRQLDRRLLERASGGGPSDAAAAARRGMPGDRLSTLGRAPGIQIGDRSRHLALQLEVLARASLSVALTAPCAHFGSSTETLGFRLFKRNLLDQNAMAFVATTGAAEPTPLTDNPLHRFARLVSAASPPGRNTR